ncbi:MAG TPA: MarR family EPS-associated transcriptional regulator [Zeimonas sp.]|nr:MarR family EPS-associated transcriptional regulator [Zeimonas sp.]
MNERPNPEPAQEETLFHVLRTLEANPRTSQRELADSMGMSLGKANYCLKALLDKGLIKMQNFRNSRNKLAYAYLLTPAGVAAKTSLTARFLKRKMAEYEALRVEIEELKREVGE